MKKSLALVLNEEQMDLVYAALDEFRNEVLSYDAESAEAAAEVMAEMLEQFKNQ
jgi:hypothetical protein